MRNSPLSADTATVAGSYAYVVDGEGQLAILEFTGIM